MTVAMKDKIMTQRQQSYVDDQERRRTELREKITKKRTSEDQKFEAQYRNLKETFQELVQEHIDPKLSKYVSLKEQSRGDLHSTWNMEVFQKMQAQIMPKIQTMDAMEITNRRNAMFDQYLDITNRKNIYLNEVDPSEYDPFNSGAKLLKYRGGAPSNCAIKGNDADPRLGEDPAKRERMKTMRERELAISLAQGSGDPNVVTAVMEAKLASHFNIKKQEALSTGNGNPHMQIKGKNSDMTFRETLNHFWWPKVNFTDSQHYDRPLKKESGPNQSLRSQINMNEYRIPRGGAVGSEQHVALDTEFHGMYGKGKRCLEAPGH